MAGEAGNGHERFNDLRETVVQHDKRISGLEILAAQQDLRSRGVARRVRAIDQRTSAEEMRRAAAEQRKHWLALLQIVLTALLIWGAVRAMVPESPPAAPAAPAAASTPHHH